METREHAFEQLINEKLGMLRGTAMRILGSPADVDDAVQEALMSAWRKFAGFRGQSEFATWVTRILINVCYDMVRDRAREHEVLADYGESGNVPGEDAEDMRLLDRLDAAVARLPKLYRESISVGVLSGRSPDEAAAMLGCSRNTLYQRIHKAKQLLSQSIREVSYEQA
ncbi:MAG: RNA polymerase sigma factor [Lentisphaeria bacterium]|nr:RNA polymerase sigma factor [Lentisphaeria bacterium]MBR3505765.1 RNA polymerase sigma factor [Lentisphaeria bacterium]